MIKINEIKVNLGNRSYPIYIGNDLFSSFEKLVEGFSNYSGLVVVTDNQVKKLINEKIFSLKKRCDKSVSIICLPPGENSKSFKYFEFLCEKILEKKIDRKTLLVCIGGGVIGDLVGLTASVLLRGVDFVQMPTTLLSQVDSSVGGKTGINSRQGKNLIGAFHQPSLVLADTVVLETLSKRHLLAGYGEIVKYGLLGNAQFFRWLEENGPALINGDVDMRMEAIRLSCQMKANIIEKDEFEHDGRALLNLGHTFCHALEAATGFSERLLHGEGVAIGCVLAFELSARMGLCAPENPSRVREHLKNMGIKSDLSDLNGFLPSAEDLFDLMEQDKKVTDGDLRFVLARDIGEAFVASNVNKETVLEVLSEQLGKY